MTHEEDPAMFGHDDPEDAWDPDDPIGELLANLSLRCERLGEPSLLGADPHTTAEDHLDDISDRRDRIERRKLDEGERARLAMLNDDVRHVWHRLRD